MGETETILPSDATSDAAATGETSLSTTLVRCTWLLAAALAGTKILSTFDASSVWDDAFMFQRYATNLLAGEGIRWNAGSAEASYGLTSLLFLVPAVATRLLTGGNTILAALLSSTLCGIAFVALTAHLVWRHVRGPRWARIATLVLAAFTFARSDTPLHFVSGMDTTFAMAYLAGLITLGCRFSEQPTRRRALALGAGAGLAFWVRPELVVFGVGVPLALALAAARSVAEERRRAWLALGVAVASLAALLLFNRLYFHSTLPLPFYAKSTKLYGDHIYRIYRGTAGRELAMYLGHYWPLFVLIGIDLARRAFWRPNDPIGKGVAAATLVCIVYYALSVLPVMPHAQRFYHPPLPALVFLGGEALGRLAVRIELDPTRKLGHPSAAPMLVLLWFWLAPPLAEAAKTYADVGAHRRWRFQLREHSRGEGAQGGWFAIDKLLSLPDDLVVATTEVGLPGVLAPDKAIVDMAGLHERAFAQQPFDPEAMFGTYRPDLIYMPHPHYTRMVEALHESPGMKSYEVFSKVQLRTRDFGVALRRDSPHYPAMRAIVAERVPLRP